LVVHAGGVTFSSEQGETMALIEAKGAAGARVNNSSTAVIDSNGYALVPGLVPYHQNDISIDPKNIDDSVELESTSQMIAPRYGAISRVQYATVSGKPVLMHVTRDDGKSLPMGAQVEDSQGNYLTMVGQGERLFIRTDKTQGQLVIRWGDKKSESCLVDYRLPLINNQQRSYTMLDSTCAAR